MRPALTWLQWGWSTAADGEGLCVSMHTRCACKCAVALQYYFVKMYTHIQKMIYVKCERRERRRMSI